MTTKARKEQPGTRSEQSPKLKIVKKKEASKPKAKKATSKPEAATEKKPAKVSAPANALSTAVAELERCFDFFNKKLYGGKLLRPIITIQTAGRMNAYGWFAREAWRVTKRGQVPEINMCAEWLTRKPIEVLSTLVHEMVHLDNWQKEIKDCNQNQYHNKRFMVAAQAIGFEVEKSDRYGYAHTKPTEKLLEIIAAAKVDEGKISLSRSGLYAAAKKKKGSKLKRWCCGCTNVRVAVADFDATCNLCSNKFELDKEMDDDAGEGD